MKNMILALALLGALSSLTACGYREYDGERPTVIIVERPHREHREHRGHERHEGHVRW
jgi:hypothetical protein